MTSIRVHNREFEIGEPSTGVLLRILNVVGRVGLRAEREVSEAIKAVGEGNASGLLIMAILAELGEDDLLKLGAAVFQFDNERDGVKWLRENGGVPLKALLEATLLNIEQSVDLFGTVAGFLERMTGMMTTVIPWKGANG